MNETLVFNSRVVDQGINALESRLVSLTGKSIDEGAHNSEFKIFDAQQIEFDNLVQSGIKISPKNSNDLENVGTFVSEGMRMITISPPHKDRSLAMSGRKILVLRSVLNNSGLSEKHLFPGVVNLDSAKEGGTFKVSLLSSRYKGRSLTEDQRKLLDAIIESEAPSIGSHTRKGYEGGNKLADFEHVMPDIQNIIDPTIGTHAGHHVREESSVIAMLSGTTKKKALLPVSISTEVIEADKPLVFFYDDGLENNNSMTQRPLGMSEGSLRVVQGIVAATLSDNLYKLEQRYNDGK